MDKNISVSKQENLKLLSKKITSTNLHVHADDIPKKFWGFVVPRNMILSKSGRNIQ